MIHIAQTEVHAGNPRQNISTMLQEIERAKKAGSDLVVFGEMVIPGYLLGDEWENERFVRECEAMNQEIIEATRDSQVTVIWGNVLTDQSMLNEDGRIRKYNAAFVAQNGTLIDTRIKTLMPTYREFLDKRHFTSLKDRIFEEGWSMKEVMESYHPIELTIAWVKRRVGLVICEDMWDGDYPIKPVDCFKQAGVDMIVNISASPFTIGKQDKRDRILTEKSEGVDFIYANHTGVQNNGKNVFVFDGASPVYKDGKKLSQTPSFEAWLYSIDAGIAEEMPEGRKIADALVYGFQKFMEQLGKKKVVLGLSGGIDSAVVAMIAVKAMGKENVIAINMPSKFNSDTTKNLAHALALELGIEYRVMPIQESVDMTIAQLEETFDIQLPGLVKENIQARDRGGRLLAWVASALDAVFTNNGNKTEVAQGYATLYGDVNGAIAPIADLYKTQVFALARELNSEFQSEAIEGILSIPPSAELSLDQNVDEGKGDPFIFEYHDKLLYQFIEMRRDPVDILQSYESGNLENILQVPKKIVGGYFPDIASFIADVERIWKNYKYSYFKRVQAPPILTVSKRAFGFDLHEAQNGVYFVEAFSKAKTRLLLR